MLPIMLPWRLNGYLTIHGNDMIGLNQEPGRSKDDLKPPDEMRIRFFYGPFELSEPTWDKPKQNKIFYEVNYFSVLSCVIK